MSGKKPKRARQGAKPSGNHAGGQRAKQGSSQPAASSRNSGKQRSNVARGQGPQGKAKAKKKKQKTKPALEQYPAAVSITARTLQELCADADLYGLLQMLQADSDQNLQLAWFWNAIRFVDAGVDDPFELGSLLATDITEDLMSKIYSVDTEALSFKLNGALKLVERAGLDVNAPLDLESPLFRSRDGGDSPADGDSSDSSGEQSDSSEGSENGCTTALHLASEVGHSGITHILLRLKADPHIYDRMGRSPMCIASSKSFNLVVDEILHSDQFKLQKGGSKQDQELYSRSMETAGKSLLAATLDGNAKIVQQLLDAGADVNYHDIEGVGVLQHAASRGQLLIVQRALAKGASLANDCLSRACASGNLATVMYLVEAGVDVNAVDETDSTPLMHAAASGHLAIVEFLCLRKADVNQKSSSHGDSAILLAAQEAHGSVVEYLAGMWMADNSKRARTLLIEASTERLLQESQAKQEGEEWKDTEGDSDTSIEEEAEDSEDSMEEMLLGEVEGEDRESGEKSTRSSPAVVGKKRKQPESVDGLEPLPEADDCWSDEDSPDLLPVTARKSNGRGSDDGCSPPAGSRKSKRARSRSPKNLDASDVSPSLTPTRRSRRLKEFERRERNQRRLEMLQGDSD